jgi:arylformamidase
MRLYLEDKSWIETSEVLDISIPMSNNEDNLRAWYVEPPRFEPVRANGFVGSVKEGGAVNFRDIFFNPHGHGTHTECLGHITEEVFSINRTMHTFICKALVISIEPEKIHRSDGKEDRVVTLDQLKGFIPEEGTEAIVIRTIPNTKEKLHLNYSATNPAYLDVKCIEYFNLYGIRHLLIDTPSVDREEDGGVLAFHHAFWGVPDNPDFERTITELVFVEDKIKDGSYLMDLQVAPFENDAAPSRPVLYLIKKGE